MKNTEEQVREVVKRFTKVFVSEVIRESTKKILESLGEEKRAALESELKNKSVEEIERYFETNPDFNSTFENTLESVREASREKIQGSFEENFPQYLSRAFPQAGPKQHFLKQHMKAIAIAVVSVSILTAIILIPALAVDFTADDESITSGACTTLHWTVKGIVSEVLLDNKAQETEGSETVCPEATTSYMLTVYPLYGEVRYVSIKISVEPPSTFTADKRIITYGECTALRWATKDAASVLLDKVPVEATGSKEVCPKASTVYTLTVTSPNEQISNFSANVSVVPAIRFTADSDKVPSGECTNLRWSVQGEVREILLDNLPQGSRGVREVCPEVTTDYTLTVTSPGEINRSSLTVAVAGFPRVWNESWKLVPYVWNTYNFEGFYYDQKDSLGKERLELLQPDLSAGQRTIDTNNLVYSTGAEAKRLNVVDEAFDGNAIAAEAAGLRKPSGDPAFENGSYYTVGWQGERYVAVNGRIDMLARLILEQGTSSADKKTLTVGETWDIGGGWTLTANSIDAKATPRQVWLTLSKNDSVVDKKVINQSGIYTYTNDTTGMTDVPVVVIFVDSIFTGATTDMVQLRYTWAIDNAGITEISRGDRFGVFRIASVSTENKSLELRNEDSTIELSPDTTVNLIGNVNFKVADRADVLRFMPVAAAIQPGRYVVRGAVWNEDRSGRSAPGPIGGTGRTAVWNAYNFAGFIYDIDYDLGKERLELLQQDLSAGQRTISTNNLVYSTGAVSKKLKVIEKAFDGNATAAESAGLRGIREGQMFAQGNYSIVGWQAERYVAVNGRVDKLVRPILEQGTSAADKKTLTAGETWDIGGGWTLTANSIDAKATPRQVWITLIKDGVKKDDRVINQSEIYTYTYTNNTTGMTDVPVFVTFVDSVFAGATTDMVQLRYTWAVDTNPVYVNTGGKFGVFSVVAIGPSGLVLKNTDSPITLPRDSTVSLMGNLTFRVADRGDVLRFYPAVEYDIPRT